MGYKGYPVNIEVGFPPYGDDKHGSSCPEMTNTLAVQAIKTLQWLMGDNHQTALLEILQHIHQLTSIVHHLQSRCQLK